MAQEPTINMLPSEGKPDLNAAVKLMVPVILEAIHTNDTEKNTEEKQNMK